MNTSCRVCIPGYCFIITNARPVTNEKKKNKKNTVNTVSNESPTTVFIVLIFFFTDFFFVFVLRCRKPFSVVSLIKRTVFKFLAYTVIAAPSVFTGPTERRRSRCREAVSTVAGDANSFNKFVLFSPLTAFVDSRSGRADVSVHGVVGDNALRPRPDRIFYFIFFPPLL